MMNRPSRHIPQETRKNPQLNPQFMRNTEHMFYTLDTQPLSHKKGAWPRSAVRSFSVQNLWDNWRYISLV